MVCAIFLSSIILLSGHAEIFLRTTSLEVYLIHSLRWMTSTTCKNFSFLFLFLIFLGTIFCFSTCYACRNLAHNQLKNQLGDMFGKQRRVPRKIMSKNRKEYCLKVIEVIHLREGIRYTSSEVVPREISA